MCRTRFSLVLLIGILFVVPTMLAAKDAQQKTHRLIIKKTELKGYPAAFASLDNHRLQNVPATREELRKLTIEADLWIEPDDPEVSGIPKKFEGATHKGDDTKVAAVHSGSFDSIERLPQDVKWIDKLKSKDIKQGNIFFVKSSTGRIYKVRFEHIEKKASITIVYQELPSTDEKVK